MVVGKGCSSSSCGGGLGIREGGGGGLVVMVVVVVVVWRRFLGTVQVTAGRSCFLGWVDRQFYPSASLLIGIWTHTCIHTSFSNSCCCCWEGKQQIEDFFFCC